MDISKIDRVYSGRSGCMCGCLGKYTDNTPANSRSIKTIAKRVLSHPSVQHEGNISFTEYDGRIRAIYYKGVELPALS